MPSSPTSGDEHPALHPAARSDLSSIWDFTAERWDAAQADTDVHELVAAAQRVAVQPERGHPADHIRPGYRRYSIGSHLLFYLVTEGGATSCAFCTSAWSPRVTSDLCSSPARRPAPIPASPSSR